MAIAPVAAKSQPQLPQRFLGTVHQLLEPLGFYGTPRECVERISQFCIAAGEKLHFLHVLQKGIQLRRQQHFWICRTVRYQIPYAPFLEEPQFQLSVLDISPGTHQQCCVLRPLLLIQNKHRIHRAADTCCAGEPVHRITVTLLSQMVHQQNGDTVVVSDAFQPLHILIVTSIGRVIGIPTHHLKGVYHNQHRIRM